MTFFESIKTCVLKTFNTEDRACRSEYWWFRLFWLTITIGLFFLLFDTGKVGFLFYVIWHLLSGITMITATVRRFNDINKSSYYYYFILVPFYGIILISLLLSKRGTIGDNQYGPDPLAYSSTDNEDEATPSEIVNTEIEEPITNTSEQIMELPKPTEINKGEDTLKQIELTTPIPMEEEHKESVQETDMVYCIFCGKQIEEDSLYCKHCGKQQK